MATADAEQRERKRLAPSAPRLADEINYTSKLIIVIFLSIELNLIYDL